MNAVTRLGAFALALGVVFGATYGVGRLVDPGAPPAPAAEEHAAEEHDAPDAPEEPGGLQVSERGYTMETVAAPVGTFAFRITGPDGTPVTAFDVAHDKRMHLIVARRDLSGFRHVHPEMAADGTWRVAWPLGLPGSWRAFADFTPSGGAGVTLGTDVHVPGAFAPRPLPAPATTTTIDGATIDGATIHGYTVGLAGTLEPGRTSKLTLTVSRAGQPVRDLQPYLGAYGHLVALRTGDLAYLHVHPDEASAAPGPDITFYAEVPSTGAYRLYLDFQHGGTVRTAEFTMLAGDAVLPTATPEDHGTPGHTHD